MLKLHVFHPNLCKHSPCSSSCAWGEQCVSSDGRMDGQTDGHVTWLVRPSSWTPISLCSSKNPPQRCLELPHPEDDDMTQIVSRDAVIIKDRHNKGPRTARRTQPLIVCLIFAGSSVRVAPSLHPGTSHLPPASNQPANLLPIEQKISSSLPRPRQCCIKAAANFQCNQYSHCVFAAALCLSLLYFLRGHPQCSPSPSVSLVYFQVGWGPFQVNSTHLKLISWWSSTPATCFKSLVLSSIASSLSFTPSPSAPPLLLGGRGYPWRGGALRLLWLYSELLKQPSKPLDLFQSQSNVS